MDKDLCDAKNAVLEKAAMLLEGADKGSAAKIVRSLKADVLGNPIPDRRRHFFKNSRVKEA